MDTSGDQKIKCVDCGTEFLFTFGEQTFYRDHGLTHVPNRCKGCREARKGSRGGRPGRSGSAHAPRGRPREMHPAVCSECGAATEVPFQPTSGRPILCRDCFQAKKPERASAPARRAPGPPRGSAPGPPRGRAPGPSNGPGPALMVATGSRLQGAVKWFNETKGFGFIRGDGGEELFVHFSAVHAEGFKALAEGDRVEFEVAQGDRGPQAAKVVRTGRAS